MSVEITAREAADAIRQTLAVDGNGRDAFRVVVQLSDGMVRSPYLLTLLVADPAAAGDARYDNLLAGLVEWRCAQYGLPRPAWTATVAPLDVEWCPAGAWVSGDAEYRSTTPDALLARGVVCSAIEFESV